MSLKETGEKAVIKCCFLTFTVNMAAKQNANKEPTAAVFFAPPLTSSAMCKTAQTGQSIRVQS